MKESLITVIIPIYKVEKYLDKCIKSVLSQTYTNLEIFLVNDGSPDNCGKMCDEYASYDSRINVIHKKNGGLSDARNIALNLMSGEYVIFIDSDDFVKANHIEVLYNLIKEYNVPLSVSGFNHYHEYKGEENIRKDKLDFGILNANEAIETMFYQDKFETSAWGKLYKNELFGEDIRYPKGILYEDLPTTYKLILRAGKIAYTSQRTYYYLLRENSIQYSAFNVKKLDILKIGDMMVSDINKNHPKLLIALKCRLFSSYMNIFLQTEKGTEYEDILWNRAVEYRLSVLSNIGARRKAVIAAFLSLFGKSIIRYCFSFINIRN